MEFSPCYCGLASGVGAFKWVLTMGSSNGYGYLFDKKIKLVGEKINQRFSV